MRRLWRWLCVLNLILKSRQKGGKGSELAKNDGSNGLDDVLSGVSLMLVLRAVGCRLNVLKRSK